jgi:hypothetical protein
MSFETININDFAQKLNRKSEQKALLCVHERLTNIGYKLTAKHKGMGFDIKYNIKSQKPIVQILYKKKVVVLKFIYDR